MAAEGGGHVHLQGKPGGGRVELGADDPDDARLLQPADPVQRRRGGQADQARSSTFVQSASSCSAVSTLVNIS